MKNVKKVTKLQLKENPSDRLILIGIVSFEPDYKLSLLINRKLKISLRSVTPLTIPGRPEEMHFSRFTSTHHVSGIIYTLVANRSGRDPLLKQFDKIDYIFIVHGPVEGTKETALTADLRVTESVTAVFPIDPGTVKDRNMQYLIS